MRKSGKGAKAPKRGGRKMKGEGFFGDLWSGIKSVGRAVPWRQVGNFIKDNNLVSKGLNIAGQSGLANAAKSVGLGKRKGGARKRRSMRGGAMVNSVTSAVAPSVIRV